MADTIVNTPAQVPQSNNNNMGILIGIIILIVVLLVIIFYGIPYLRTSLIGATPQVTIPSHYSVQVKQSK